MGYHVSVHPDPGAFLERAESWLREREALFNLHLSLASARRDKGESEPDCLWATVESTKGVVGCVIRTPPHKLLATDMPAEAAPLVAATAADRYESIPAVLGPTDVAQAIGDAWVELKGGSANVGMAQRIYRLTEVIPVSGVPGSVRRATEADVETIGPWGELFGQDAGSQFSLSSEQVRERIERGAIFVWEDGGAVSMAMAQGDTGNGCRVGFVFTPKEVRGRGYASALVAAVSQIKLDEGLSFCTLYTDLSNPTSNSIYQKIGYVPIADVTDIDIIPPANA